MLLHMYIVVKYLYYPFYKYLIMSMIALYIVSNHEDETTLYIASYNQV